MGHLLSFASGLVLALLISSSDSTSQVAEDDCQHGECFGMDMFPEKSFHPGAVEYIEGADLRVPKLSDTVEDADVRIEPDGSELGSAEKEIGLPFTHADTAEIDDARASCVDGTNLDTNCGMQREIKANLDESVFQTPIEQLSLLITRQQIQLQRLERLSQKLQDIVEKLEELDDAMPWPATQVRDYKDLLADTSGASAEGADVHVRRQTGIDTDKAALISGDNTFMEDEKTTRRESESPQQAIDVPQIPSREGRHNLRHAYSSGMTVARYKPAWSEHFQFLSAIKVDSEATCLHVLPHEGEEGLSKYVAVGVDTGRVYIFSPFGDLLVDHQTVSHKPVTAMLSFLFRKNETMLLTGHSDGMVLVHKLCETIHNSPPYGDDWHTLFIENIQSLIVPNSGGNGARSADGEADASSMAGVSGKPVKILEVYRVGKMRYILVSNSEKDIWVFRENGTYYGSVKTTSQPLAFLRSPNSQRLLFLTQDGVASLDLRSLSVKSGPCESLNNSKVLAYAFDAAGRSKAYGFTDDGQMIYVAISGDTLHFECHVRSKRRLEVEETMVPQGIKGYLLVATPKQVLVYNTTLQVGYSSKNIPAGVPRFLFTASVEEISLSFLGAAVSRGKQPVIVCNRDRLVVLGFGDGYVAMYKSNLPVQKAANFDSRVWSSPVVVIVLMMVGGWFFIGKKRDPTMSMIGPDGSLTTRTPGYGMSRMDDASNDLTDSPMRYSGPSRAFPGGGSGGYKPGALDYRSSVADQSFRASEPSFRGLSSSIDPSLGSTSSLEARAYLRREAEESKYRVTKVEAGFRSPLSETTAFLRRDLRDLKALRGGSSSLGPRVKSLQEPNSF